MGHQEPAPEGILAPIVVPLRLLGRSERPFNALRLQFDSKETWVPAGKAKESTQWLHDTLDVARTLRHQTSEASLDPHTRVAAPRRPRRRG